MSNDNSKVFFKNPIKNLVEGLKKVQMFDHEGDILLPETTASMVSEEPDRRFLDAEEKEILYKITNQQDNFLALANHGTQLASLAGREQEIISIIDTIPSDWSSMVTKIESLEPLMTYKQDILSLVQNEASIVSNTTGAKYFLGVDDTDQENPKLILTIDDTGIGEPSRYTAGDTWTVPENAKDVVIDIPLSKIAISNTSRALLEHDEVKARVGESEAFLESVLNGAPVNSQNVDDALVIPQIFSIFNVEEYIKSKFEQEAIMELVSGFRSSVLMRPLINSSSVRSQIYRDKVISEPIRVSIDNENFQKANFESIIWNISHDDKWLNGDGKAIIITYGKQGKGISTAMPELSVTMVNPYKGKTLTATKSMGEKFNILDWVLVGE